MGASRAAGEGCVACRAESGGRAISGRFDKLDAAMVSTLEKVLTS
ncbi:hypothetical protein Rhow_008754 [Rhodococcus wratislaviensis]|uniref:Uncharacterized protein n=1 Tax=Rhodococcus wratislaviensis TaxID=44752 RepID=A0A402CL83_RHOWR|nr:hypothetical protein Rhow_008754 [Rhodococcus wratislaviensis]